MKELNFLERSKEIIEQIKTINDDSEKIDKILTYLSDVNALLVEHTSVINDLLINQKMAIKITNVNLDSMSKINDRIIDIEKHLQIHDTHIEAHDQHFDILGKHLDAHDQISDILSQRLDLLE
jgi:hypothetical protein